MSQTLMGPHMEGGLGSQIPRVLRYQELFGASGVQDFDLPGLQGIFVHRGSKMEVIIL